MALKFTDQREQKYNSLARAATKALRGIVEHRVFERGKEYYREGAVREWQLDAREKRVLEVTGTVEGSDIYDAQINFDLFNRTITNADCSCPYEFGCKHIAALGLHLAAFFDAYENDSGSKKPDSAHKLRDALFNFAQNNAVKDATFTGVTGKTARSILEDNKSDHIWLEAELSRLGIPTALLEETLALVCSGAPLPPSHTSHE